MESNPNKRLSDARRELKEQLIEPLAASIDDHALNKVLRRARKLPACNDFNLPEWGECMLPDHLRVTRRKTPFLLHDSSENQPRPRELHLTYLQTFNKVCFFIKIYRES